MMSKLATVLRNDAELDLLTELLRRERNRIAGARTFSMDDMRGIAKGLLNEGQAALYGLM